MYLQRYHANSIQKLLDGMTIGSDKTDIKTKKFTRRKDTFYKDKKGNPSQR